MQKEAPDNEDTQVETRFGVIGGPRPRSDQQQEIMDLFPYAMRAKRCESHSGADGAADPVNSVKFQDEKKKKSRRANSCGDVHHGTGGNELDHSQSLPVGVGSMPFISVTNPPAGCTARQLTAHQRDAAGARLIEQREAV